MSPTRVETQAVAAFKCLGSDCPDTCCQGWGMQVMPDTIEKYQKEAPELLDSVVTSDAHSIMKRDPVTDRCVKFEAGWCGIHRDYGSDFLGDACHFFPRITRALGATVVTTAALSCPEAARLMLVEEGGLTPTPRTELRMPFSLRNYLPEGLDETQALAIHQQFLDAAGDPSFSAEHNLMRVSATVRALDMQPVSVWPDAVGMYLMMADGRVPPAETAPVDPFNLLQALYGLFNASPSRHAKLQELIAQASAALGVTFGAGGTITLSDDALALSLRQLAHMRAQAPTLQPILRRYVQAQLSQALFPFAGLGEKLTQRITIIGVRLATVKLLLSLLPEVPSAEACVETIQTLSRFVDHLADPGLSLQIYEETGWTREPRLRSLLGY